MFKNRIDRYIRAGYTYMINLSTCQLELVVWGGNLVKSCQTSGTRHLSVAFGVRRLRHHRGATGGFVSSSIHHRFVQRDGKHLYETIPPSPAT